MTRKIENPSLFAKALQGLKTRPGWAALATLSFWVMTMVALAPAIISPLFLFLTLPFVFAPSFHQYLVVLGALTEDKEFSLQTTSPWRFFTQYFHPQFRGSFRLMQGFWKGLLAFSLAELLVLPILFSIAPLVWGDFNEAITQLQTLMANNATFNKIAEFVLETPTILNFVGTNLIVLFFFGFMLFAHNFLLYGMNIYVHAMMKSPIPSALTIVYRDTVRANGREFRRTYYGTFWPIYLLGAAGFFVGGFLGMSFTYYPTVYLTLAAAMALTFMMLYFPIYASGLGFFFETFRHRITTYAFGQMRDSLERLKKGQEVSSEEISQMEKAVGKFEEDIKREEASQTKEGEDQQDQDPNP